MDIVFALLSLLSVLVFFIAIILLFIKSKRRMAKKTLLGSGAAFIACVAGLLALIDNEAAREKQAQGKGFPSVEEYKLAEAHNIETFAEWREKKADIEAAEAALQQEKKRAEEEKQAKEAALQAQQKAEQDFYTPPDEQIAFVQLIDEYRKKYRETSNPIAKTGMRKARATAVCQLLPDGNVKNWVGTVAKISTGLADDDASLEITLVDGLTVKTISDTGISPASPIYYKVARVEVGSKVSFSGNILKNDKRPDCLYEFSITESGSINEPEYVFQFSDIDIFYADPDKKTKINEEAERQAEEARTTGAKERLSAEACMEDIKCTYDKFMIEATGACRAVVGESFKYKIEWQDGFLTPAFSRAFWYESGNSDENKERDTFVIWGDKLIAQNGFGAWKKVGYYCAYNFKQNKVVGVEIDEDD